MIYPFIVASLLQIHQNTLITGLINKIRRLIINHFSAHCDVDISHLSFDDFPLSAIDLIHTILIGRFNPQFGLFSIKFPR